MKHFILVLATVLFYSVIAAQSSGDFRTIKSGNWSDTSIWQKYNAGSWKAARAYPKFSDGAIAVQDGNEVAIDLNITLDQVTVQGGAILRFVNSNYTVTLNNASGGDDLIANGLIDMEADTITGAGTIRINGALYWVAGSIQSALNNAGTISIDTKTPQNPVYVSNAITNNGIMNFVLGTIVFNDTKSSIINNHIFTTSDANSFISPSPSSEGAFTNNTNGIFNVDNHAGFTSGIVFTNKGTINFITSTGVFVNAYLFTNQKIMNFSQGGFINNDNCIMNFNTGATLIGTGTMTISGTVNVNTNLNIQKNIAVFYGSNLSYPAITGSGSLTINGDFVWYTGSVGVPVTITSTGAFTMSGNNGLLTSSLTNNGAFTWGVGYYQFINSSITNNNTIRILGDYELLNYAGSNTNTFTNNATGIITKTSYGTTKFDMPFVNKGTIAGAGTFDFGTGLTNTGVFAPGIDTATNILTTGQNYNNSTLSIKMNGATPGTGFDRLSVKGNVTLGGTLNVTSNTTMPAGTYTILTCTGALSGNFTTTHLPSGYTVQIKPNSVIVKVAQNLIATDNQNKEKLQADTSALSVYPNPATNYLHIHYSSENTTSTLRIFDANSTIVYQSIISNDKLFNININKLLPGTYMLNITGGGKTETSKFIKQ